MAENQEIFAYTIQQLDSLDITLSTDRLGPYLALAGGDRAYAVKLYHECILARDLKKDYSLIVEAAHWICPVTAAWLKSINSFHPVQPQAAPNA